MKETDTGGSQHFHEREFAPTSFSLRNVTSVLVMLFIIAILGIISYRTVPKEAQPEITIPIVAISTIYPGVAPGDIETLVTRVIEEELNNIADLKTLSSTSVEGYSSVVAEFGAGMDMNEALQKVREKLDLARPRLPRDAEDPVLSDIVLSEFPIMQVNISGEYSLVQLKDVAEELKERLETIPSILEVRLSGGLEREVKVDVDLPRLKFYGVSFTDVVSAISNENITIPGGAIDVGNQKYLVRVDGEFRDTRILEDIVVTATNGRPIYIRDVAEVDFGFRDRDSFARLDGNSVVTLDIVKRSGENIIGTSDAVKSTVAAMEADFPPTTVVKITSDQSEDIRAMVLSLENNIISGLILVLAVLLFFLGVRNASLVAVSIPLSMLLSFVVMKGLGMTMNMIVLFSLILALGMLVDNAIVVVENIYRYKEKGADNFSAARYATGEVAMPIIASTLTTLGAFAPMMFWPGIIGEFMKFLPLTLIITLSSSLFVALVIVPTLAALFMRVDGTRSAPLTRAARWTLLATAGLTFVLMLSSSILAAVMLSLTAATLILLHRLVFSRISRWVQDAALPRMLTSYERRLRWALDHRAVIIGMSFMIFVGTGGLFYFFNNGSEFFPESIPPASVYVQVEVPSGTTAAFTDGIVSQVESRLPSITGMGDAESVVATVSPSSGGSGFFGGGGDGTVAISFRPFQDREYDVFATLKDLQEQIGVAIPGADITVTKPQNGPPSGKPINIEIAGDDSGVLRALGEQALAVLRSSPVSSRLEGLDSDMSQGRPELVVDVDREKAAIYGLSTAQVGSTVRSAIQGAEAAKFRAGQDEYDIVVRLAEEYRSDLNALQDLTVLKDGRQIPLPSVASWRTDEGAASVIRKDLKRVVTVSSEVRSGENANAVLADVRETLSDFVERLPAGYALSYTGQQENQEESQNFLFAAFLVALLLMGFVLISQFNSVLKPLIILTSVIMSTVGVLVGLMIFRMPFGIIMTGVGVISLAGVVVNNAIVLIDFIDILRERDGLSRREAIVEAGRTRFRPVILTAMTTVLGLVPLAIGFNFDFLGLFTALDPDLYWGGEQAAWWGPMAIAVIAGLTFATVLTLVLVPVMYSLLDDLSDFFTRHYVAVPVDSSPVANEVPQVVKVRPRPRVPSLTGFLPWSGRARP
ncbi:efflux RND transporter permease subunit [soil metagenome]